MKQNIKNSKYEYIFFDLDDTLLDFQNDCKKAFKMSCDEIGLKLKNAYEIYNKINMQLWDDFADKKIELAKLLKLRFELFFKKVNFNFDNEKFQQILTKYMSTCGKRIKGAKSIVKYLHKKYTLIAITNGVSKEQKCRLKNANLDKFFNKVFISQDIGTEKPNPEFFKYCLRSLKLKNTNNILIVGDSLKSDIKGGILANIETCWFNRLGIDNNTNITPNYVIKKLKELKNIL